jgi:uncharacterized LabA/DUF88 family protein
MNSVAHGFVDGAYLRRCADELKPGTLPDPRRLVEAVCRTYRVQSLVSESTTSRQVRVSRVTYYDAAHDDDELNAPELQEYWKDVELLDDTQLGFGTLRGQGKRIRQKGVDTLIAVDMLVGAFSRLFDIAVLVAGDADFIPVVAEVRRRGVTVVLVAPQGPSLSDELLRSADRFVRIAPASEEKSISSDGALVALLPMRGKPRR